MSFIKCLEVKITGSSNDVALRSDEKQVCIETSYSYRAFYHILPSFIRQTIHVLPKSLEIVVKRVNKNLAASMNNVFKSFAMIMKI